MLAALAFLTVGISLKLALFPLHQWLPNAYTYAPSAVSAFLAGHRHQGRGLRAGALLLLGVRPGAGVRSTADAGDAAAARPGRNVRGLDALPSSRRDLKRLFAYSSVAQIGYIILGLSFDSVTGLTAAIVHLFNHGVTKGAIFMLLGGVGGVDGRRRRWRSVQGSAARMPLTSLGIVLCGLSLIGVPGTAGFISKWYLILAALEKGQWWLVFADRRSRRCSRSRTSGASSRRPTSASRSEDLPARARSALVDACCLRCCSSPPPCTSASTRRSPSGRRRQAASPADGRPALIATEQLLLAALVVPVGGAALIALVRADGPTCAKA